MNARRQSRGSWRIGRLVLYGGLGLLVLVALLLVALRTSFAREQIRKQINSALSEVFQGRIELDRIGGLGLAGVREIDAKIFDPSGKQVVRLQGLSVTASLPSLGWQLLTNGDRPDLVLNLVHARHADIALRDDAELGVSLAAAFMSRTPDVTPPQSPPSGPHLRVERIVVDHIWAHGVVASSPPLDVELTRLQASVSQSADDGFGFLLERAELVTRGLPRELNPRGRITGKVVAPADAARPLRLETTLRGEAAGSPLALEASWVGDDVHAHVELSELPASYVNQQVAGVRLEGKLAVRADVDGALPVLNFVASIDAAAARVEARGYAVADPSFEAVATVEAVGIDAASIVPDAPQSELDLRVDAVVFEASDGALIGAHRIEIGPGRIGPNITPPLWVNGKVRLDSESTLTGSGQLAVADAGLSLSGRYGVKVPSGPGGLVTAALQAELNDPARLAGLGLKAAGHGELSAELRLAERSLTGKATLSLRHLDHAVVQARNVEVRANASGTLDQPHVQAAATLDLLSGRAHVDLDYAPLRQELALFVSDVDLLRLSTILGVKLPVEQATLGVTARVARQGASANYALNGEAKVDLGKLGVTQLTAVDFQLPTSVPRRSQWGELKGDLSVKGNLQLEALSPLLTRQGLPIERTTGSVRFEATSKHSVADLQGLELSVAVDTTGLRIVEQRKPPDTIATTADAIANQPLALEGIDLRLSAHARPKTGEVYGTLLLRDQEGTLADVEAELQLPELLSAGLADAASFARLPLKVRAEIPRRKLGGLPPLIRPTGLRGRASMLATLEGTLAEPRIVAQLSAQSLHASGAKQPVDVEAEIKYAPERGECRVDAKRSGHSSGVAHVKSAWRGDLRRVGILASGESGLVASADVEMADFPLDIVPMLADRQVGGQVSGKLSVTNWGQDAQLNAELSSKTLSVGKMPIRELTASAKTSPNQLLADVVVTMQGGTAHASLDSSMRWGRQPLPELARNGTAKLDTRAFDLATLTPMLASYVSELGGTLDAQTQLIVTPTTTELSGAAKLQRGVVQLPALGQRFSDISTSVAVTGKKVKLEDFTARGTTGRITGRASASLEGFDLRGAEAHFDIAKNEALPLTLEGAALGDVSGKIDAVYTSPAQGERKLEVEVPVLRLVTPETSGYDLQSLDAPKDIRVGVRRADGTFIALPVQPLDAGGESEGAAEASAPLRIRVRLGQNVVVERGRSAQVQLGGELQIVTGIEMAVDGRIEVRGGKLDVQGKTFDIERGVITFQGDDPGNPTITATARWDAPEYTVYADYVGDVKTGRIKLRSEPPLSPSEIANLLLFGTPEGSAGGGSDPNTAALAVGLAGDTAAQGFNKALDDFTNLDVSARIDTSTGSARPELVFQVSPRVSARVTRAIGAPSVGQPADRTFLTLELRLKRSWALSAVFGDHGGSALDLIWRKRY